MAIAKKHALEEILARARRCDAAAELSESSSEGGSVVTAGTGEIHGTAMRWWRAFDRRDGRSSLAIEGPLPERRGWDGQRGFRVDEAGLSAPFDLADVDELIVSSAIASGAWADCPAIDVEDVVREDGASVVLRVRARGADRGLVAFHLTVDEEGRARRLRRAGRGDDEDALTYRFGDEGDVPRLPRAISLREGWLEDVFRVESIETRIDAGEAFRPPSRTQRLEDPPSRPHDGPLDARFSKQRLPLVRAEVDGVDLGLFLVDTGAGSLAIDTSALRASNLTLAQVGRRMVKTSDGLVGAALRRGDALRVGSVVVPRPLFLDLDLSAFSRALKVKLGGVLGYDFFRRSTVTIEAAQIAVAPSLPDPDRRDVVPLRFEGGRPVIAVKVPLSGETDEPATVLLAIDTGSAAALTLHAGASQAFARSMRGGARAKLRGVGGTASAMLRRLPWIELGPGLRFEDVDVVVSGSSAGVTGDREAQGVIGSLGMGLLRDLTMTFDYATESATFTRTKREFLRAPKR